MYHAMIVCAAFSNVLIKIFMPNTSSVYESRTHLLHGSLGMNRIFLSGLREKLLEKVRFIALHCKMLKWLLCLSFESGLKLSRVHDVVGSMLIQIEIFRIAFTLDNLTMLFH